MDLQLVGKRALVTGSSSGLGEAIVKLLVCCLEIEFTVHYAVSYESSGGTVGDIR